ncbi:sulfurtransferase complex subunit TusC [Azospirillum halopraeferens]|uniref:sulfurtransferase complex subunit TusC n=1 Tax=Azospirillum halopraeferens TaxID=34010 RepID=UPI00040187C4|nr:sulfurtransferase complex subunit TusC [Azospirillum halopraeferens]
MSEEATVKKFMYLNRKAPHGTIYALEVLEMILVAAMFDQDVHVCFADDGVYELKKGQDAKGALEMKDFVTTYRALDGYDIEKLYAEKESLEERGLTAADLVVPVEVIDRAAMAALIDSMDVVLSA